LDAFLWALAANSFL